MERLTRIDERGIAVFNIKCPEMCEYVTCSMEEGYQCQHQCERDIIEKLATYEDADEQGLLLRLPCKVGDKIYAIVHDYEKDTEVIKESMIIEVTQNVNGWFFKSLIPAPAFRLHDFGKIVFLTREAAEAKLKEMGGITVDEIEDCHYCEYACCSDSESSVDCYVEDFAYFDHHVTDPKEAETCGWFRFCNTFPKY